MKIYVAEYDFEIVKMNSNPCELEHKIYSFTNVIEFINHVKSLESKWYISNIKTHVGETKEIDINKVLNPF